MALICNKIKNCKGNYLIAMSAYAHEEIIWFDVPMYEVFIMNIFYSANHLQKTTKINTNKHYKIVLQNTSKLVYNKDANLTKRDTTVTFTPIRKRLAHGDIFMVSKMHAYYCHYYQLLARFLMFMFMVLYIWCICTGFIIPTRITTTTSYISK